MLRKKPSNKKKAEFSKILAVGTIIITIIILGFACYEMHINQDLSHLDTVVAAVCAEAATATSFYYNKAKAENQIKLKQKYGEEVEDDGIFTE